MIAGPKMGMMVKEYEVLMGKHEDNSEARHHEDTREFEKRFTKHVKSFVQTLENEGSPFSEEEDILVTLISKVIMNEDVVQSMKTRPIHEPEKLVWLNIRTLQKTE